MLSQPNETFKFLLVGNSSVGKTCIVRRLCHNDFDEGSAPTIGVDFLAHTMEIDDTVVTLHIWDTAGQEKYQDMGKAYYRNAMGVLLIFSLTDHGSFEDLSKWQEQVIRYCSPKTPIIIVGNKGDLIDEKEVSDEEVRNFAESRGLEYIESSAKTNKNVEEAFYRITRQVYTNVVNGDVTVTPARGKISAVPRGSADKGGCGC